MPAHRPDAELSPLCKRAEQLAARRREPLSTVHLLMAVSAQPGGEAAAVLDAHRLTPSRLEALVHTTVEPKSDAVTRVVGAAHAFAARTRSRSPGALHLLLALLGERGCVAYCLLEQTGVDVPRLRASAMQVAIGATAPRRALATPPAPSKSSPAVAVRLSPQARPRRASPAQPVSVSPAPLRTDAPQPPHGLVAARPVASMPAPTPPAIAAPASEPRATGPRATDATARFVLDPKRFPVLASVGRNLTLLAARGEAAPVVGREAEVQRCLDVLAKRHANNPVLVGAAGVGKSSVMRAVAAVSAAAPRGSSDERIFVEITLADLNAGAGSRSALAERFAAIRSEVRGAAGRVVLVLDDAHQLLVGDADVEVGAELRLALARGELPCIGVTTPDELRRVLDQEPTLARRLCPILVDEPSHEDAFAICRGVADALGAHHGARYPDSTIAASVTWSARYMPGRPLPDKALALLDLAGARARRRGLGEVAPEVLAQVVSEQTDVPAERLLEADAARMLGLETALARDVIGHGPMLARIATILRRNAAGIHGKRPIGTFLLLGPSGVGKTETAKAIARALFHEGAAMTRVDLSEFSESHAVARLIGAPPGYVGHEAGGQLTEAVRRRPYQVILLDEIEKAHPEVMLAFLQVFDEGRLTDGRGRTIDFTNTVLVLTSNLGSSVALASPAASIGFARAPASSEARVDEAAVVAAARAALPPELYNRIDDVLVFAPLTRAEVCTIARKLLAALSDTLDEARGIRLSVGERVDEALLAAGGYDAELGARPMKRVIATRIEAPLADMILRGEIGEGDVVRIELATDGALRIHRDDATPPPSAVRGAPEGVTRVGAIA